MKLEDLNESNRELLLAILSNNKTDLSKHNWIGLDTNGLVFGFKNKPFQDGSGNWHDPNLEPAEFILRVCRTLHTNQSIQVTQEILTCQKLVKSEGWLVSGFSDTTLSKQVDGVTLCKKVFSEPVEEKESSSSLGRTNNEDDTREQYLGAFAPA